MDSLGIWSSAFTIKLAIQLLDYSYSIRVNENLWFLINKNPPIIHIWEIYIKPCHALSAILDFRSTQWNRKQICEGQFKFMVFIATFNNISSILCRSVLLMEETGENHRPVVSHWQSLSHNVVSNLNLWQGLFKPCDYLSVLWFLLLLKPHQMSSI
jgi:hypothetical protein